MQTTSVTATHKKKKRRNKNKASVICAHVPQLQHNKMDEVKVNQAEKRTYSDDDAGDEKVLKKKKKKIKSAPSEPGQKKTKSIRQQKRDKHAARLQEAEQASKDVLKSQCIEYLSTWKHDKQNWKFMKAKQHWLFKNKFSPLLIPANIWPTFLAYFASAQGNIKHLLLEDSKSVIEKMDAYLENEKNKSEKMENQPESEKTENQPDSAPIEKPDEVSYKRARDIIQHLDETG